MALTRRAARTLLDEFSASVVTEAACALAALRTP
jgi:hypothetical protein